MTSLAPVVKRLQEHLGIQRVCIVADRGMISAAAMAEIESRGRLYILGVRMRRTKEAREEVLSRGGRHQEVSPKSADAKTPSPLAVKEVRFDERRCVVLPQRRPGHQGRGRAAGHRQRALVEALKRGDKSLIDNNGFRRFATGSGARCRVDEAKGHGQLQWAHILDDLDGLQEIELTVGDKPYRLRTQIKRTLCAEFSACGAALPPTLLPGRATAPRHRRGRFGRLTRRRCGACKPLIFKRFVSQEVEDGPRGKFPKILAVRLCSTFAAVSIKTIRGPLPYSLTR